MNRKSILMFIMIFILTLSFFNTKIVFGYTVHIKEVLCEHVKYDRKFYGLPESTYILAGITMSDIVDPLAYTVEVKWDTNTKELPFKFYIFDHAYYVDKLGFVPPTSFDDWDNKSYTFHVNDTPIYTDTIADGALKELSIPDVTYNRETRTVYWNSVEYADGYAVRILNSTDVDDMLFDSWNLGLVNQYTFDPAYHSLLDSGAIISVEAWDYTPGNLTNTSIYVTNSLVFIEDILDFFDDSVADGAIEGNGKKPKKADAKLRKFEKKLKSIQSCLEKNKTKKACKKLKNINKRCDLDPKPPDLIIGDAVPDLSDMILDLMENLGCE